MHSSNVPYVSVIIATHDRRHTLARAIDSVLSQTFSGLELIIVDDGSTDETRALVEKYGSAVTYQYQSHAGVSRARNYGSETARGEWLAFLDSDDVWLPTKVEKQLAQARQDQLRFVHSDERWIRRGKPLNQKAKHKKSGGDVFLDSLRLCVISPSAAMIRKDLFSELGAFDEALPACEDYDLWLRVTCREEISYVDEVLVIKHGGHADQLSRTTPFLDRYRIAALVKLLRDDVLSPTQRQSTVEQLRCKGDIYIRGAQKHGRHKEAQRIETLIGEFQ
ncbi:MAG: glycosyltransferase [Pseudomonadota bacterium]